jgi:hypothetical protein
MKDKMSGNLKCRNVGETAQAYLERVCILDPRFKELNFLPTEQRVSIKKCLVELAIDIANTTPDHIQQTSPVLFEEDSLPRSQPAKKRLKLDFLSDIISVPEEQSQSPTLSPEERGLREVERYMSEPPLDKNSDPLEWWSAREAGYPLLCVLVRKYVCIPASSTPPERVFSTAGNIVSKKRSRLSADNVDMLIFLNKNRKN